MFQYVRGKTIYDGRLIDRQRQAEFRDVSGMVQSNMMAALLTWEKRQIPLEYAHDFRIDATTGREYTRIGFEIGSSRKVRELAGVEPYKFRNAREKEEARLLTTEALLAHMYKFVKGDWDVEGLRVISEGKEWKASDFGYNSSDSLRGRKHWTDPVTHLMIGLRWAMTKARAVRLASRRRRSRKAQPIDSLIVDLGFTREELERGDGDSA